MVGEAELADNTVQVKLLNIKEKAGDGETEKATLHKVERSEMVEFIYNLIREENLQ